MADINTELTALMNAVYGEEVRSAFRNALLKMNNDVTGLVTREALYQMTQEELVAIKNRVINEMNAAAATAKGTIPPEYSALADTVASLFEASYPSIAWQAGTINSSGVEEASDYICRSNFIPATTKLGEDIESEMRVSVTGEYKLKVYAQVVYDRNKNYLRTITKNRTYPVGYSANESMHSFATIDGYVRLVAGCIDDNDQ